MVLIFQIMNMYFFIILCIILLTTIFIKRLSSEISEYNSEKKILNDFTKFTNDIFSWSKEIKDIKTRYEYINFIQHQTHLYGKKDIKITRDQIIENFIDYIPSLKQQVRNEKIENILKDYEKKL
jgi:predicted PurR-regulated permease PerM